MYMENTMTGLQREKQEFLINICRNPKDDTVRLVYADWLQEHGEEERAEFIRLQIELEKCGPPHKKFGFGSYVETITPAGPDYYTFDTYEEVKVGDRIDIKFHTTSKYKYQFIHSVLRGLLVTRVIPVEGDEGCKEVVIKRDEHSGKWKGEEIQKKLDILSRNPFTSEKEVFGNQADHIMVAIHRTWTFTRGFVSEVQCNYQELPYIEKNLILNEDYPLIPTIQPLEKIVVDNCPYEPEITNLQAYLTNIYKARGIVFELHASVYQPVEETEPLGIE